MSDFSDLLDRMPGWSLWVVFSVFLFWFIGSRAAEGSEGFAKIIGPLGTYWRKRASHRANGHRADIKKIAREVIDEAHPRDYEQMRGDLARLTERVTRMQEQEDMNSAYLVYDTAWHFEYDQLLAEHGIIGATQRIAYRVFAHKFRGGFRLGDDGVWFQVNGGSAVVP